nr:protein bem46 [Quercus suber]
MQSRGQWRSSLGLAYVAVREIIYPRNVPPGSRTEVPKPSQFGIEASECEELSIQTPDGETLHAFLVKSINKSQARPVTIISFHGNAGNIGHRLPIAHILARDLQCTTLLLEYRGYGQSTGTPSEKGLAIDAQAGIDYLRQREDLKGNRIVVYGQSLGGAVSIDLVAKNSGTGDIHGLMLENTFLSIPKMIPTILPMAKVLTPLCHEYWRSEAMIGKITDVPILFLSGLKDEIVPPSHMRQLFNLAKSESLVWRELPEGDHNSTVVETGYFGHIDQFITGHIL